MGGKNLLGISLVTPVVKEADPEFLLLTVRDGREGTPMIPFGSSGINLSDQDILDVVGYVRTIKPAASPKE
jgi:mono/diheme cytochrome c family protein